MDADVFLEAVDQAGGVPLAIRPLTLTLLLKTFASEKALPTNRNELYEKGCSYLVEENNPDRRAAGFIGGCTNEQRLSIAGRIAAITVFGNHSAIWIGQEGEKATGDLSIQGFCDVSNGFSANQSRVTPQALMETLDSGLFASRGENYMGWVHQTFAEFLAARYLVNRGLDTEQILSLLRDPDDPLKKTVPQLYETAAWLSEMHSAIFSEFMETEPEILLESDVKASPGANKAQLVSKFLELFEQQKLFDLDFGMYERYRKLEHEGLAEQLLPYIRDKSKFFVARRAAIDIAEACRVSALQNDLLEVALDATEGVDIRVQAAYAIARIGDLESKLKLRPLAFGLSGEDPDDELKGIALDALWPGPLTAKELFGLLDEPKNSNLFGAYARFLDDRLAAGLKHDDLPHALRWVKNQKDDARLSYSRQAFIDAVMAQAWEQLEQPDVLAAFADTAWVLLKRHDSIFNRRGEATTGDKFDNEDKRRKLAKAILPLVDEPEKQAYFLAIGVLRESDFSWLLGIYESEISEHNKDVIAHAIVYLVPRPFDSNTISELLDLCGKHAEMPDLRLSKALNWLVEPVLLDSPEANTARKHHQRTQDLKPRRKRARLVPSPTERIENALLGFEAGNIDLWPRLLMELSLEDDSLYYRWVGDNLLDQPGWKKASPETRQRILVAGRRFLEQAEPNPAALFTSEGFSQSSIAAYPALFLILTQSKDQPQSVPTALWEKWAPLVVVFPYGHEHESDYIVLLKLAYRLARDKVLEASERQIDIELSKHGIPIVLHRLKSIWDARVAGLLFAKLQSTTVNVKGFEGLLDVLLEHNDLPAREFAVAQFRLPLPPASCEARDRSAVAAALLLKFCATEVWSHVWTAMQSDGRFGEEVMLRLADERGHGENSVSMLSEEQTEDLYLWLEQHFPASEDPKHEGAYAVSPRDNIKFLRDGCISRLEGKGTSAACNALQRIADAYPDRVWFRYSVSKAWKATRRANWLPPPASSILKLTADPQARLVRTGEELLDAVRASLRRMQKKLQNSSPPQAPFLWDEPSKRPKTEQRLSEYTVIHLKDDLRRPGIIANREVEVKNLTNRGIGERTDILVQAISPDDKGSADVLSLVVETKGCWNRELMTAMKTQLKDDYLKSGGYSLGLYLVGWYICPRWGDEDDRKQKAIRVTEGLSLEDFRERLDKQANNLCDPEVLIRSFILDVTY